jgi:branched-chain amino acid transport system permease protein
MLEILPQLLVNSLITGSIYALAASGLALSFGLLRILNFAHGHLMMVGAYLFLCFHSQGDIGVGLPLAPAIVCTAGASALVGIASFLVFIRPFARISPLLPFVTTLALSSILEAVVSLVFGVNVKSLTADGFGDSIEFAGVFVTPIQILIFVCALAILGTMGIIIHATPLGRKMRALAENPYAAEGLGVRSSTITLGVFVVGCLLATLAGVLVGYETNLQPTMGNAYTIKAFAAMILGGLGNVWGAICGAYILGLVENLAIGLDFWGYSLPAGYKDAFAFVIILFVLLLRPQGLFGTVSRTA